MSAELEGKVAIITGAGKGLGQAIAERFGQAGATVAASTSTRPQPGRSPGTSPAPPHIPATSATRSRSRASSMPRSPSTAPCTSWCPTLVSDRRCHCCTWTSPRGARSSTSTSTRLPQHPLRRPRDHRGGGGSIVTLASVTATTGSPLIGHYAAAKAAVVNLTKTAATELRPYGVQSTRPAGFAAQTSSRLDPGSNRSGLPAGGLHGLIPISRAARDSRRGSGGGAVSASSRSSFCTGRAPILDGASTPHCFELPTPARQPRYRRARGRPPNY